jgi:Flp pilus assembly protein TadD
VLQLLRDHPDTLPRRPYAPMKCMAYRELRRWLPAIRAAKAGGIRNGRYPGAKRISPAYTHSLIEAGDEIEALKILGKHQPGEPAYYDWLRGMALHRAGDREQAAAAFQRYSAQWPNDILGATKAALLGAED